MRKIFLLLFLSILSWNTYAQTYTQLWKNVDSLMQIKNYRESGAVILNIRKKAIAENNSPEKIRTIIAEHNALTINKENTDAFNTLNKHFQNHLQQATGVEKSVIANLYAQFLLGNISLQKVDANNYYSLPIESRIQLVDSLFTLSLSNKEELTKEPLDKWGTLLTDRQQVLIKPTLYHLLALNYLDFLAVDSSNKKRIAALIAEIQQFNTQNNYKDAAAFLSYRPYITGNAYSINQSDSLISKLATIQSSFNAHIYYLVARQKDPKEALQLLKTAKEKYPTSPWISNVDTLYELLSLSNIAIQGPSFVPYKEYAPIKISHKNSDKLYIRVYNISSKAKVLNHTTAKYDTLTHQVSINAPLVYEEVVTLKQFDDPYTHTSIYKINPLPYGQYQILASNNPDFKDDGIYQKTISSSFYVSDMFISAYEKDNKEDDIIYKIQLINRKSGKPYANKSIPLYYPEGIGSVLKPLKKHKTNAAGEFTFKKNFSNYELDDIILYLKEENQWINLEEVSNIPDLIKEEVEKHETNDEQSIILTDRAIYRPGQPVHFKAILHSNNFQTGKIIPNQEVIIRLKDVNNQEIKSQTLTTNSFGSIHGTFDLPAKVLNGRFRLELFYNNNSIKIHGFQVEEYKRPTFKVSFEPNKNTYNKKDTAIFIGKVESLTGVPLPNSEVKYTLNIDSYAPSKSIKIDSIIRSNALGEFNIAVPLMDTAYAKLSSFYISITAEVKSPTEEIQKAHTSYSYNDQPAVLGVSTLAIQKEFAWKTVNIATTNTNGFPLPFSGVIHIYKYESPSLPLGDNAFSFKEEYNILDTLAYQKLFPNYYDKAVHRPERKKTLIASYPFDTNRSSSINIDSTLFAYGEYILEGIAVLNKKDTLISNQQVKVYNVKNRKYNDNTFLSITLNKHEYSEKDTVRITFYSDVKDVQNLFLWRIEGTDIQQALVLPFQDNKAVYEFIADAPSKFPKATFEALLIKDNKIKRAPIYIPYKQKVKKDLTITTKTFRDKITPGQTEKWSFTVAQQETAAEVLASMYDSAIDQFSSNNFNSTFYLSYPYYSSHRLNHLTTEFNENSSWQSFAKQPLKSFRPVVFPQFKNYGLWSNTIYPYHRLITKKDKDGNIQLQEVIIRGFSTQKKMNMTGSVSTLNEVVVTSLEGRIPGIVINEESMALYDELKDPDLRQEIENLKEKQKEEKLNAVSARTNLQETAFFYPELYTDKEGNITFEFETPEALTKWKVLLFAHTKDLQAGNATFYTHTQKQLMVQPNLPRFMRVGDKIVIKSLITNLSEEKVSGTARLQLIDPTTNQVLENILLSDTENKDFSIDPKNNNTVSWTISAPEGYPTVYVKIIAATDKFSDGEQHELAIIPNDILISDTQKILLNKDQQKEFHITSTGKNNLQAQVLLQTNPILEILSALDYLKTYPYDCAEQVASKWFAVKTVQYIQNHYPVLANYFSSLDTTNMTSALREKASTSELSLAEMPWLRGIVNEEEQLKQLATLFNTATIKIDLQQLENRLLKLQKKDGSFVWFDGGPSNLSISIRILEIFGKIQQLDSTLISKDNKAMLLKLKTYLDQDNLFDINSPYQQVIDYAYARQYWKEDLTPNKANKAWILQTLGHAPLATAKQPAGLAAKSWTVAQQYGLQKEANAIFNRLDQEYIIDSIAGIYWKSNGTHYNTISLHTYLLEAYKNSNPSFVQGMADWLYYNKSNTNWRTTWMSVDAIYALLLTNNPADFVIDNKVKVNINHQETTLQQTAIGLSAQRFTAEDLQTDKVLSIENKNNNKVYGSIVHQYFVPLEEVKASAKDIAVTKHILVFRNNEWISTNTLKSGEKVKIRLEVIANKNLNFVHLKDNRAAGFEPEYRPSGYQFRNGGYYFTNKDASTNYFIDYLTQGTHIFEYEVKTNTIGLFNSGISTVECMYDPSVHARSGNLKIEIIE